MAFPRNRRWPVKAAAQDAAALPARANKFNARKQTVDGHTFDSGKEAKRYCELKILRMAGEIRDLELQPKFWIDINGAPVKIRSKGFPNGRRASYRADFSYVDVATGEQIVEDVKGGRATATEADKLRRAVVEAIHGIRIREV